MLVASASRRAYVSSVVHSTASSPARPLTLTLRVGHSKAIIAPRSSYWHCGVIWQALAPAILLNDFREKLLRQRHEAELRGLCMEICGNNRIRLFRVSYRGARACG